MSRFVRRISAPFVAFLAMGVAATGQEPDPAAVAAEAAARKAFQNEIGFERLKARMGSRLPTGAGVWVAQVEPLGGDPKKLTNRPDLKKVLGGERAGFVINATGLGDKGETSDHSTQVATELYGKDSLASGVTRVDLLTPDREFLPQWLGVPNGTVRSDTELPKVSSHSYVIDRPMLAVVRRLDDLIEKTGHVAVVAVGGNNQGSPVASLFGSSYNAIVVGLSNTKAAYGDIREGDDVPGRTKPDLVVPVAQTSSATPVVASAVAMLVEAAGGDADATKPVVLKACLLAGASKTFTDSKMDGGWQHQNQTQKPLHPKFGAGQLDVDAAHRILTAGRHQPGPEPTIPAVEGWAVAKTDDQNRTHGYVFDIPDETEMIELTAAITWNRRFTGPDLTPELPHFEIRFGQIDVTGQFDRVLDQCVPTIDNVGLIWHTRVLPPGRYGFRVSSTSDDTGEYGLAWKVTTRPAPGKKRDLNLGKVPEKKGVSKLIYLAIIGGSVVLLFFLWQLRPMFRHLFAREKKPVRRRKA